MGGNYLVESGSQKSRKVRKMIYDDVISNVEREILLSHVEDFSLRSYDIVLILIAYSKLPIAH
jgi:hypothetical protein